MEIQITMRPFCAADQDPARTLILEGLGEHFGFIDETCNPDIDNIAAHYLQAGHCFFVAEYQDQLIATGALMINGDETGQIVRVSVRHEYRRRGIASAVVRELLRTATALALSTLRVETTTGWADAIGLYQALGFTVYDQNDEHVYLEMKLATIEHNASSKEN